jgi:hypothetical protein
MDAPGVTYGMTLTAQEPAVSHERRQRVQFDAEHDQAFGASRPSL